MRDVPIRGDLMNKGEMIMSGDSDNCQSSKRKAFSGVAVRVGIPSPLPAAGMQPKGRFGKEKDLT